jgi:hypothetical protein
MKKSVTFDFDLTLADTTTSWNGWIHMGSDGPLTPIKESIKLLFDKHREGYDIHIVSFREDKHKKEMEDFVKEYNLPIKSITCTGGKSKTPILVSLRSELHIDDDIATLINAQTKNIQCLLVDGGQHENNTSASLFEKIKVKYN